MPGLAHRRWLVIALCVPALACDDGGEAVPRDAAVADTGAGADDVVDGDAGERDTAAPTPWIFEDDAGEVTPTLAPADLTAAIDAALAAALEIDPIAIADLHELLYPAPEPGSGDPTGCPFFITQDYGSAQAFYWQGECTDAAGTSFSGYGYVARYDDYATDFGTLDGFEVYLAGAIEAADGTRLEGAGGASSYEGGEGDVSGFGRVLDGTFTAGGARAPSSAWLDGTRRPSLSVTGWVYLPTGGRSLTVSGGIGGLEGFPGDVTAVALDGLTVRTQTAGASCPREPGGAASVRGPDGSWYDVVFDGPTDEDAETPAALCDGCGETWFRGQPVTATCVDAAPYLEWQGSPW